MFSLERIENLVNQLNEAILLNIQTVREIQQIAVKKIETLEIKVASLERKLQKLDKILDETEDYIPV